MSVFADTSGLYAVFDRDDANYAKSQAAWARWLREGEVLVTNNYVLLELTALLQHRRFMRMSYRYFRSIGCRRSITTPASGPCSLRHEGS